MKSFPIVLVLASLAAVVAVAKTQRKAERPGIGGLLDAASNRTYNPLPDDVREGLNAQARPHGEALKRARELFFERKFKAAEAECRRAVTLVPLVNGKPWYGEEMQVLGDILLAQGRNQEALECFLRQKTSSKPDDPRKPRPNLRAALAYCRLGDLERARKYCPPRILAWLAAPERRSEWIGTTDLQALEASLLFSRASDEDSMANSQGALLYLEPALKLAPRNWRIAQATGRMLDYLNRYDEAVPHYKRALQFGGDKVLHQTQVRARGERYSGGKVIVHDSPPALTQ